MDIKSYFSNKYLKMRKRNFIFLTIIGLWLIYFFWAAGIGERTILMDSIPVWETHLIIGLIVGSVVAYITKSLCYSKVELLSTFILGGVVGSVCILHVYAVCAYLAPGYIIKYESEYKYISNIIKYESGYKYTPNINKYRYSYCRGDLSIKDIHTQRWIKFCESIPELDNEYKQGVNTVWVTARVNKFGTYIIDYKFISESERNYLMSSGAESSM